MENIRHQFDVSQHFYWGQYLEPGGRLADGYCLLYIADELKQALLLMTQQIKDVEQENT